ncbi:hypothetical protein PAXRUDRAFT_150475, partial [Paxillus rubicundulus Ve08.2h10]
QTINAQWLTSAEGLQECDAQDAAREAKAKKKTKVAAWKVSKQANRITRQAAQGSDVCFSGALSTKSKEDLIDVANQLKIKTAETKLELLKAIRAHFDAHMARSGRLSMLVMTSKIICPPQIVNMLPQHQTFYHHPYP